MGDSHMIEIHRAEYDTMQKAIDSLIAILAIDALSKYVPIEIWNDAITALTPYEDDPPNWESWDIEDYEAFHDERIRVLRDIAESMINDAESMIADVTDSRDKAMKVIESLDSIL